MTEAVKEHAKIDFAEIADTEAARKLAEEHNLETRPEWQKVIISMFSRLTSKTIWYNLHLFTTIPWKFRH